MKIFLSGLDVNAIRRYSCMFPENKINVLMSYFKVKKKDIVFLEKYRYLINNVMLDSGVYTLNSKRREYGSIINLKSYTNFLKAYGSLFDYYYNFDEDFSENGFDKNLRNQMELEKGGFCPVPVIHNMRSNKEYQFYINEGYPFVSIGSSNLQNIAIDVLFKYVEKFYANKVKIHLLGSTNYEYLAYTPSYSCDSSTWSRYAMKNSVVFWNPEINWGFNKTDYIDFHTSLHGRPFYKNYPSLNALNKYLKDELGFKLREMVGNANSNNRVVANVHHFYKAEQMVNKLHQEQGFNIPS